MAEDVKQAETEEDEVPIRIMSSHCWRRCGLVVVEITVAVGLASPCIIFHGDAITLTKRAWSEVAEKSKAEIAKQRSFPTKCQTSKHSNDQRPQRRTNDGQSTNRCWNRSWSWWWRWSLEKGRPKAKPRTATKSRSPGEAVQSLSWRGSLESPPSLVLQSMSLFFVELKDRKI